jgi:L-histidine N-alpha-methyltransferase
MYDVAEHPSPDRDNDDDRDDDRSGGVAFHDHHPGEASFRDALQAGLAQEAKAIPCRFLYDAKGSALFDRITDLPEYYPTRTETQILRDHAGEIADLIGPDAQLVELGSGSSTKVRILLDALQTPSAYVPIDISREHLLAAAAVIQADYPALAVEAVCADYDQEFDLPPVTGSGRRAGFYPGSTIGNLEPEDAQAFMTQWSARLGAGAMMLVGVDLRKAASILEPAYDDAQGVTAEFSKNLLVRANRELGSDFDTRHFRHRAVYNPAQGQVRIDLVSTTDQTVTVAGQRYDFALGEAVHVENSNKYTVAGFRTLARSAGFEPVAVWADADELFSVHMLQVG